jgi:formylglycine-generating enzyme required for sulfatase activity
MRDPVRDGVRDDTRGAVRNDLRDELARARDHTDRLFDLVDEATLYERPIADRHRLIFYLGHLDAFDWNQVARDALGARAFHPGFDRLFAAGIDPPPGQAPQDRPADWPTVDEVRAYVGRVRSALDALWDEAPEERRRVALEHRWMHAETLCYLLHRLAHARKRPPADARAEARATSAPAASAPPRRGDGAGIAIPAGRTRLGQQAGAFGWDNEFPSFEVDVPAFAIGRHKVTNGEYLRFVADGGPPPPFWCERDGRWWLRRMFDDVPLPAGAPVYVTHRQATAYAAWAGAALPTEAQWQRAAFGDGARAYPWGDAAPTARHGHFDFSGWDPVDVTSHADGASAFGVQQMVGNGWEWTATPFNGFEGFAARAYYPGYSADFFDGAHWVLKGASPRTARCLLRRSFRNWFRGDYPFAYTAFRIARA